MEIQKNVMYTALYQLRYFSYIVIPHANSSYAKAQYFLLSVLLVIPEHIIQKAQERCKQDSAWVLVFHENLMREYLNTQINTGRGI